MCEIFNIMGYHAHIYYNSDTRRIADALRVSLDARFKGAVKLGRWHDKLVGPHTRPMYQVAFNRILFAEIVPWLALNRRGLVILVHPESGDVLADHTLHAVWFGEILDIDVSKLS